MARGEMLSAFCLTEPQSGSDAGEIRTRAERRRGSYILNGTKQFITSGKNAERRAGLCRDRSRARQAGHQLFHCRHQAGRLLRCAGSRTRWASRPPIPAKSSSTSSSCRRRTGSAPKAKATASRSPIWKAAASASPRKPSAWRARPTRSRSPTRRSAAASARRSSSTRPSRFAWPTWRPSSRPRVSSCCMPPRLRSQGLPCLKEASMAKLFATEAAERICSDAIQTLGGAGYMTDYGVERIYRAVRASKIYEGTNDIQRLVISRALVAEAEQERRRLMFQIRPQRCRDHADAEPAAGQRDQQRMAARCSKPSSMSLAHARTAPCCISARDQKVFCAGADLSEMRARMDMADGPDRMYAYVAAMQRLYARIETLPQVTLAEIGGAAMGGGLELALACDLRIARQRSQARPAGGAPRPDPGRRRHAAPDAAVRAGASPRGSSSAPRCSMARPPPRSAWCIGRRRAPNLPHAPARSPSVSPTCRPRRSPPASPASPPPASPGAAATSTNSEYTPALLDESRDAAARAGIPCRHAEPSTADETRSGTMKLDGKDGVGHRRRLRHRQGDGHGIRPRRARR